MLISYNKKAMGFFQEIIKPKMNTGERRFLLFVFIFGGVKIMFGEKL